VLQCAAVCCSVVQYVAVCCSVLQCIAVWMCCVSVYGPPSSSTGGEDVDNMTTTARIS